MARILVIDDSADVSLALRFMLRRVGLDAVCAADGPASLAAIARHAPDVIVLDARLSIADGGELLPKLRATAGVPVIETVKPVDMTVLLDRITDVLRVRAAA